MSLRNALALVSGKADELPSADTLRVGTPYIVASLGDGSNNGQQFVGSSFTTINVASTAMRGGSWSSTNHTWAVPYAGLYLFYGKLRLLDNQSPVINYGIGIGTSNADSPSFAWHSSAADSTGKRSWGVNVALMSLAANDAVRLFSYIDASGSFLGIAGAELAGFLVS